MSFKYGNKVAITDLRGLSSRLTGDCQGIILGTYGDDAYDVLVEFPDGEWFAQYVRHYQMKLLIEPLSPQEAEVITSLVSNINAL